LSYPEILPKKFHEQFLYSSEAELENKLRWLLGEYRNLNETRAEIAQAMAAFDWKKRIEEFDALFENMVRSNTR
jgi:hypothetical protein